MSLISFSSPQMVATIDTTTTYTIKGRKEKVYYDI